jgi:hypothetical protein
MKQRKRKSNIFKPLQLQGLFAAKQQRYPPLLDKIIIMRYNENTIPKRR